MLCRTATLEVLSGSRALPAAAAAAAALILQCELAPAAGGGTTPSTWQASATVRVRGRRPQCGEVRIVQALDADGSMVPQSTRGDIANGANE